MTLPVDGQTRARVLQLHEQGVGRNEIARITGISTASVSKIVHEDGGSFDTSQTELATQNRLADLAAIRADLARGLLDDAVWMRERLRVPGQQLTGSGALVSLTRPDGRQVQAWMTALGIAVQRSVELTRFDSDKGQARAESLLDAIAQGISAAAEILNSDGETGSDLLE